MDQPQYLQGRNALPPGQQEISDFPRCGLFQFAWRIDRSPAPLSLEIAGDVRSPIVIAAGSLATLPRVHQLGDLHCVTTWTRRQLQWSGVRFKDFYHQIVLPQAEPDGEVRFVIFTAGDGYRRYFVLDDALADDVLLADRLAGAPLTWQHGAPLRLVAPAHYGFRSAKHLQRIEFCKTLQHYRSPTTHWTEHPRARVAFEERGRVLPARLYRCLYRAAIPLVR